MLRVIQSSLTIRTEMDQKSGAEMKPVFIKIQVVNHMAFIARNNTVPKASVKNLQPYREGSL